MVLERRSDMRYIPIAVAVSKGSLFGLKHHGSSLEARETSCYPPFAEECLGVLTQKRGCTSS